MSRPPSEAAELILTALGTVGSKALTYDELREQTSLSASTLDEKVEALEKAGKVDVSKDGHGTVWVMCS